MANDRNAGRGKLFICEARRNQRLIPAPIYDKIDKMIDAEVEPYLLKKNELPKKS